MTQVRTDWTLDVAACTATHCSGLVLVATKISGSQYQVQPRPGSLPTPAPEMSSADQRYLHQVISQRVTEGGQLLVEALSRLG